MNILRKKFTAFTLAEVLIVLGIIGIIAEITIPTLIQNEQEKVTVTRLKKTYSTLEQAYMMAVSENGTPDTWGLSTTNVGNDSNGNPILDYSGSQKFLEMLSKYLKKTRFLENGEFLANVYTLDGRPAFVPWDADGNNRYLKLLDGTIIAQGWISNNCTTNYNSDLYNNDLIGSCSDFWVIFPQKRNLKLGVDVFNFLIFKNGFFPQGKAIGALRDRGCSTQDTETAASNADRACASWVLYNGNMDYLHCDDLSWNGKLSCK